MNRPRIALLAAALLLPALVAFANLGTTRLKIYQVQPDGSIRGTINIELSNNNGTLHMSAPTGSLLVRDGTGTPFLLYMPDVPAIQPKPR
jgi:hypothetical protein